MPPPLDQWLEQTENAEQGQSDFDRWLSGTADQQRLETSVRLGQAQDPDKAARVFELQGRTGLPPDLIERNLETVEREARAKDFDAAAFRRESPIVADWLAEQPAHVALAYEDLSQLGYLERQLRHISQQNEQGQLMEELSRLGERAMFGDITPEQRRRATSLQERMGHQADFGIDGFFEQIPGAVANQLPILQRSVVGGIEGAAPGMAGGALVGGVAGSGAAGVGAVPGAATGAVVGGVAGWRLGAAMEAGRMEAGLAYMEFEGLEAEDGTPLSREAAVGAAATVGVINGALEVVGLESMLKSAPVLRGFTRRGMRELLKRPSVRDAMQGYFSGIGRTMLVEGGTEFLQEMVTHVAGELAVMVESGDISRMNSEQVVERLFGDQALGQAVEAGRMGMQAGGGISAVVSTPAVVSDVRNARRAQRSAELFTAVGESVQQAEISRRLPQKLQELVGKITGEGNGDTVYMDRSRWDTYWQSQGVDPREVATEVMGDATAYDQASAADTQLGIPTSAYAAKVAGTEHHQNLVRDIHFDPMGMSAREADEYLATLDEQAANAADSQRVAGERVREDVFGQLLATGMERGAAERQAEVHAAAFRTLAERTGQDPEALYQRYGLTVRRALPEILTQVAQTDQLDVLIDRLRGGDVPSERDAFGESLLEFVRRQGLTDEGGELAARDIDVSRAPFQRRVVREDGRSLDDVAEIAQESGFISERSPDALLEALDRELAGEPVFAQGAQNDTAMDLRLAMEQLADFLDQAGIDLEQIGNAQVKEMLASGTIPQSLATQVAGEMVLDQYLDGRSGTESGNFGAEGTQLYQEDIEREAQDSPSVSEVQRGADSRRAERGSAAEQESAARAAEANDAGDGVPGDSTGLEAEELTLSPEEFEAAFGAGAAQTDIDEARQAWQEQGTDSPYFREWFGDSKMVRRDGTPVVFYHGTNADNLQAFDRDRAGETTGFPASGLGAWLTADRGTAQSYGENVLAGYVRLENPFAIFPDQLPDFDTVEDARAFSEELQARGFDGIYLRESGQTVIFESNQYKLTDNRGTFDAADANVYHQAERIVDRGSIRFGANRQFNIELYEDANLSTFLHESGHFFLEVLGDLAQAENAPKQIRDDYQAILDWFGVESRDAIGTEQHEQWARGFEAYLMEGKAPSAELRPIFSRFRAWLREIYKRLSALNVELSDEVRGVMDRLLATDAEIEAASFEASMQPLFETADAASMTEAEFADYQVAVAAARIEAEEDVTAQAMRELQREELARWKDARAQVRAEVAEEVHSQKEYIAAAVLGRGKLPNGEALPEGMPALKLSRAVLQEAYGKDFMKRLPRPYIYAAQGGVHPDVAADLLGFDTGEQLVLALADLRPMNQLIEAETDVRMRERHGDIRTDGTAAEKAIAAVHNEGRAEVLLREITNLAARTRRRVAPLDLLKHRAQRTIAEKRVRDVRPDLYLRAERKAAREAFEAAARQDFNTAGIAKQRQLFNHELYRAARDARERADKARTYFGKFDRKSTRQRLAKAGEGYLDQIDALLARFELKRVSNRALDRRARLAQFITEHEEQGFPVAIPERLRNEAFATNTREMTVEELQGLEDAVRNIEHLARIKSKLVARAEARDMDAAVDEMVAEAERFHDTTPEPIEFAPGLGKRFLDKVKHVAAAHTKLEFLFEWMDGNQAQGAFWRHLFQPIAEAELVEQRMLREVSENIRRIFSVYEGGTKAEAFFKRVHIPQVGHLTRSKMLVVALNWGNQYNREALLEGYGWSEAQVQQILSRLTARDWNTVQEVWDYIDSFWPQIAQMERDLTGLAPEKVQAAPVVTEVGEFRGGYYPIIFDSKLSWRQSLLDEKANTKDIYGGSWARAMTRHGHTKERTNTGGKPIKLEISGMSEHLTNVVHDLAYRRAIIDVDRLSRRPEIRRTIEAVAGREYYRQINPWLNAIARDRRELANPLESVLAYARTGATVVNMGWKVTTAMVQPLGYTVSVKELGLRYATKGLRAVYGPNAYKSFREAWEFVTERSTMMSERPRTYDRDVRDTMKRLNLEGGGRMTAIRSSFFIFIGYMDMSISLPTWMGAYQKAMDGGVENIKPGDEAAAIAFADRTVRVTQSAGAAKDLALVQSGSETFRIFTMFYSYFSVLFNQFQKAGNQFRLTKNVPELFTAMMLLWFVPVVLENLMRNAFSDEEPEERLAGLAFDVVTYPFQTVVLLRDVVSGMGQYGYDGSAALDFFESLSRVGSIATEQGQDLLTGEDNNAFSRADARALALATGYTFKLPARQVWTTGEYFHDWLTGETHPENPAEGLWRLLVSGKPHDER